MKLDVRIGGKLRTSGKVARRRATGPPSAQFLSYAYIRFRRSKTVNFSYWISHSMVIISEVIAGTPCTQAIRFFMDMALGVLR